jgi:hypothetical protein
MNPTTLAFGQKLGMFPVVSYGAAKADGFRLEDQPGFSSLSPEKQNELREKAITGNIELQQTLGVLAPFYKQPSLEELEAAEERRARRAQEIGKESLKEGFKYSMLANIPKSIAQSYAGIAATNLYGGQAISDTVAKTLAAYPSPQFASINFQPQKYFG